MPCSIESISEKVYHAKAMMQKFKLIIAKIFFYLLGYTPLPLLHFIGAGVGLLLYCLPIRLCYYGKRNIQLCFPELSLSERKKLFRKAMMETGKGFLESPTFFVRSGKHLNSLVKYVDGVDELAVAMSEENGVLALISHTGGYYLINPYFGNRFENRCCSMYKPQRGLIEKLTQKLRERYGVEFFPANQKGVVSTLRALHSKKTVALLCDHNALENSGIAAPFFNINVPSMTLAARLANKSKAPAFFLFMQRLPWGRGYHLHAWRVPDSIHSDDLHTGVTTMNAMVEKVVRFCPEQHEWLYRRFWDRPKGEPGLYKPKRNSR
jgi:KDO2-lipid IV(A) lauroyltransferase